MRRALLDKVAELTVSPAGAPVATDDPAHIVFTPRKAPLEAGFAAARRWIDRGETVRLIGDAATYPSLWPSWVRGAPGLTITEFGAYHVEDVVSATAQVRADLHRWLDRLFADLLPGQRGGAVFYGSLCGRIAVPILEDYPVLDGVAERHAGATIECVDRDWVALEQLRKLVSARGGTLLPAARKGSMIERGWPARIAALSAAGLVAVVADQARAFRRGARSRKRIAELRAALPPGPTPKLWMLLTPSWWRINRHLLVSFAEPALAREPRLGVLLFGSLAAGRRVESDLRRTEGDELWPALGAVGEALDHCVVDQLVGPESEGAFVRTLARAALRSARVAARLAAGPHLVEEGGFCCDLAPHAVELAKLVTQDVFRATLAEQAVRELVARHDLRGASVVHPGTGFAGESMADLCLQSAGATTIDFVHGTAGSFYVGEPETRSTVRCVWTHADAASSRGFGQRILVAGMPTVVKRRARPRAPARNVLVLSNYVHRDDCRGGLYPWEPFQDELLGVVPRLRARFGDRFALRWRPHPADADEGIARGRERCGGIEVSRGVPLEADVAWADLFIGSLSSATIEALLDDLPVFMHVLPAFRETPVVQAFARPRTFFRAAEAEPLLVACVEALDRGDEHVLDPERKTRLAIFGEEFARTGASASLLDLLDDHGAEGQRRVSG